MKRHYLKSQSGQMIAKGLGSLGCAAGILVMRVSESFSEPLRSTLYHAAQGAISIVVSFLSAWGFPGSNAAPIAHAGIGQAPVVMMSAPRTAKPAGPLHLYSYVFEGRAMQEGKPCALAGVVIHLTGSQGAQVKGTITDKNGNYSLPFDVYASHYEPIQWSIEARNGAQTAVKITGQQIAMREDDAVTLANSLDLAWLAPGMLHHEDQDLNP